MFAGLLLLYLFIYLFFYQVLLSVLLSRPSCNALLPFG